MRPRPAFPLAVLAAWSICAPASDVAAQAVTSGDAAPALLTGTVRGRLDGDVTPLAFALVELTSAGGRLSAMADADGRYAVEIAAGDVEVAVAHIGYERLSLRVSVPPGDSLTVDLELAAVPVPLPPVDIRGGRLSPREVTSEAVDLGGAVREVDLQALDVGPGVGQPGLAEVVSALPGNDPDDATDVLFMRGTTADLKLVLLDGVPVYTPFHVAGLMKSFEQNVLGAAEMHVGGAPARFDGGLTHILELRTRPARSDRLHVSGAVDLLSASAAAEAPIGGSAGMIVSGRSLHGLGAGPLGGAPPYGYRDLLMSASVEPASAHEVRGTAFFNDESVDLDESQGVGDARWANRAGSLGYRGTWGGTTIDVTGGLSGYRAELPLQPGAEAVPAPAPGALLAAAETDRTRVVGEAIWGRAEAPIRAGLSFETIRERYSARPLAGGPSAVSSGSARMIGAFLDVTRGLAPGINVRGGLRVDHFSGGDVRLAPRGMLAWEVGPEAVLSLAVGRYHQPTRASEVRVDVALADLASAGTPPERLPVATADHVVLGLAQRFSGAVRMDVQGFWKGYRGLPGASREAVRSSGVDVRIVTAVAGRAAWLGYGLSWFWSSVDLSGTASEFVGRHLLSAGASGRLIGPLEAEARMAYGAGLPYTSIPFGRESADFAVPTSGTVNQISGGSTRQASADPLVEGLDETFLRLDLEVHAVFEPTWAGRSWRVKPYLRILNALDRRDALFYTFQPWRDDSVRPVAERPALPLLGVAFSF